MDNITRNIAEAWNEVEEAHTSLCSLTDEELVECRDALAERMGKALWLLSHCISPQDLFKFIFPEQYAEE